MKKLRQTLKYAFCIVALLLQIVMIYIPIDLISPVIALLWCAVLID